MDPAGYIIKPDNDIPKGFNMIEEQQKDEKIGKLKNRINKGTATKAEQTITLRQKTKSVTCETASAKKPRSPLHEWDIPPYPFAKMALDLS